MLSSRCVYAISLALVAGVQSSAFADVLPISPVAQEQTEWCWAASAEMVLQFYGVPAVSPDYQCGIIAGAAPQCEQLCYQCNFGAPGIEYEATVLTNYPALARQITGSSPAIAAQPTGVLSLAQLQTEIAAGHPVIAGITPDRIPQSYEPGHATVIVGVDMIQGGVFVNDPWPYDSPLFSMYGDPYLAVGAVATMAGQYEVPYQAFIDSLHWTASVTSSVVGPNGQPGPGGGGIDNPPPSGPCSAGRNGNGTTFAFVFAFIAMIVTRRRR